MYQFIYYLKVLAILLITSTHYGKMWPNGLLAGGGGIGNCLFFVIAGFVLYQLSDSFPKWYLKRIKRIYPCLILVFLLHYLTRFYRPGSFKEVFIDYIFPTRYHFITSIMILYIVYYAVIWLIRKYNVDILKVTGGLVIAYILLYAVFFDKSYYHISETRSVWIRIYFFIAMMMGACFRDRIESIDAKVQRFDLIILAAAFVAAFGKRVLNSMSLYNLFQIYGPLVTLALCYCLFRCAIKLEKGNLLSTEGYFYNVIYYISSLTLEIYLCQFEVIYLFQKYAFPMNVVCATYAIVCIAWALQSAKELFFQIVNHEIRYIKAKKQVSDAGS